MFEVLPKAGERGKGGACLGIASAKDRESWLKVSARAEHFRLCPGSATTTPELWQKNTRKDSQPWACEWSMQACRAGTLP
jgi:hypothetical protein